MNKRLLKIGLLLIVLGEILYFAFSYTEENNLTNFAEFTSGILLGISIGINLIGIIIVILGICNYKEERLKDDK